MAKLRADSVCLNSASDASSSWKGAREPQIRREEPLPEPDTMGYHRPYPIGNGQSCHVCESYPYANVPDNLGNILTNTRFFRYWTKVQTHISRSRSTWPRLYPRSRKYNSQVAGHSICDNVHPKSLPQASTCLTNGSQSLMDAINFCHPSILTPIRHKILNAIFCG